MYRIYKSKFQTEIFDRRVFLFIQTLKIPQFLHGSGILGAGTGTSKCQSTRQSHNNCHQAQQRTAQRWQSIKKKKRLPKRCGIDYAQSVHARQPIFSVRLLSLKIFVAFLLTNLCSVLAVRSTLLQRRGKSLTTVDGGTGQPSMRNLSWVTFQVWEPWGGKQEEKKGNVTTVRYFGISRITRCGHPAAGGLLVLQLMCFRVFIADQVQAAKAIQLPTYQIRDKLCWHVL